VGFDSEDKDRNTYFIFQIACVVLKRFILERGQWMRTCPKLVKLNA
jgi:hypothetical protein